MKKLLIILLSLTVLFVFNISSFAYFNTQEMIWGKSVLPSAYFYFDDYYMGEYTFAEDLSIYECDSIYSAISDDYFESGEFTVSSNSLSVNMANPYLTSDIIFYQNIVLYNILPSELSDRYPYMISREYILDEFIYRADVRIETPVCKISPEWNDIRVYVQNTYAGVSVNGFAYFYSVTEDGYDTLALPISAYSANNELYFGDLLEYPEPEDFDFCQFMFNISWQPSINPDTGKPTSSLNRIHFDIPLSYTEEGSYLVFKGMQVVDMHDLVVNIRSINDFNFLEWLANSVQSFFSVTLFRIGSVPVSVGVCMLVPLSLSILIGFLKKFSGG